MLRVCVITANKHRIGGVIIIVKQAASRGCKPYVRRAAVAACPTIPHLRAKLARQSPGEVLPCAFECNDYRCSGARRPRFGKF